MAVIGLGLIGASVALAIRRARLHTIVVGVDVSRAVIGEALARRIVHEGSVDIAAVGAADLVLLAAPVLENVALLGDVARHVSDRAVVTDVGSTKRAIVEAARLAAPRMTFVGGHPIAGAAAKGLAAARPDLFAGRKWVFTPDGEVPDVTMARLFAFASGLGAVPCAMTADEHDRLLALASHLPHLVVSALMHIVGETGGEDALALAGAGLADTTRIASSPPRIWKDILATNSDNIRPALLRLIGVLSELADANEDAEVLERVFASACAWRQRAAAIWVSSSMPGTGSPARVQARRRDQDPAATRSSPLSADLVRGEGADL
ncbi:MAG: prephenate dehydrogenase [Vicinamibacterales bacterium]